MTKLLKAVKRTADVGREVLVVTLYPGAVLGLRRIRTRKEFTISLQSCYVEAIEQTRGRERLAKLKARGQRVLATRGLLTGGRR